MAVVTERYFTLSTGSHGVFWCDLDYEDTDFREINLEGEPDDFRLVRFHGENGMDIPVIVGFKRGNGAKWFESEIAAGATFERNASGPVRYETDLPEQYIMPQG